MKKVKINLNVKTHYMHVWTFAHREARRSNFASAAADNERFKRRIQDFEALLVEINFFSKYQSRMNS